MIASTMHQPDWNNFTHETYKTMLTFPKDMCFGAWEKSDPKANKAWARLMLKRFKTQ